MQVNKKYREIKRLYEMLVEAEIPCEIERTMDGWQVFYPNKKERISDAIEFTGSYGCEVDKLEIMGLLTYEELEKDFVAGYLTAEDVFERWEKDYKKEDNNDIHRTRKTGNQTTLRSRTKNACGDFKTV